jgi:hypothetical protein
MRSSLSLFLGAFNAQTNGDSMKKMLTVTLLVLGSSTLSADAADLSECRYQPKYSREDQASLYNPLPSPVSYYFKKTKEYFLAVDMCQKSIFEAVGGRVKVKPSRKSYSNQTGRYFGMNYRSSFKNSSLNIIVTLEHDNTLGFMRSLGFEEIVSAPPPGMFLLNDESLEEKLRVCKHDEGDYFVPCATLPYVYRN